MTLQKLATKALKHFTTKERDGVTIHVKKANAPQWLTDLVRTAHGDMLPDDYKYSFIVEALEALSSYDSTDDARDSLESDIYNRDLLNWVSSRLDRAEYVNEAVRDFGIDAANFDQFSALQSGQLAEKSEVFQSVLNSLEERQNEDAA